MTVVAGDSFLGTAGYRESTRWAVGAVPKGGLVAGRKYWVLAESGIVGELFGQSPLDKPYLGQVKYLGAFRDAHGHDLNVKKCGIAMPRDCSDRGAPVFILLGTSAEVGKTTAALSLLRSLRHHAHANVVVLKATGTASLGELMMYRDYGASEVFDFLDFGLPTTLPSGRRGIARIFERMLDTCLSKASDAILIECGSDMLGANVPTFLKCLRKKRAAFKTILAATDPLAAVGGKRALEDMGLDVNLITGPCTDTPITLARTQKLCGTAAINMS